MSEGAEELGLKLAVPGTLAALGLVTLWVSIRMGNPLHQPLGPGLVPGILSVCIVLGSIVDLAPSLRRLLVAREAAARGGAPAAAGAAAATVVAEAAGKEVPAGDGTLYPFPQSLDRFLRFLGEERDWVLCTLGLLLGIYVWSLFGFVVGMAVCVLVLTVVDRTIRLAGSVAFTAVLIGAMYLLFEVMLEVSLG